MQKGKITHQFGPEEHHSLCGKTTVLGAAKRQDIDTCLPGHLCRRHIQCHQGIRKAGTVHVHTESVGVRDRGNRLDLFERINGTRLTGLRDADGGRLRMMHVTRTVDDVFQRLCRDAPVCARHINEFCPTGKQLRCATFIGVDMCKFVAKDFSKRWSKRRKRECIGRCAGRDRKYRNRRFKDFF